MDILVLHDPDQKDEMVILKIFLQGFFQREGSFGIMGAIEEDPRGGTDHLQSSGPIHLLQPFGHGLIRNTVSQIVQNFHGSQGGGGIDHLMGPPEVERNIPQFSMEAFVMETPLPSRDITEFLPDPEKGGSLLPADF